VAVTAGRIVWFPSAMVTAEQRGPGSGDDREDARFPGAVMTTRRHGPSGVGSGRGRRRRGPDGIGGGWGGSGVDSVASKRAREILAA
jgi:hypothetical protein